MEQSKWKVKYGDGNWVWSSNVIPPGERAGLTVTFDASFHTTRGEVTRLVWFATNDPTQPWVEVRITADVQS